MFFSANFETNFFLVERSFILTPLNFYSNSVHSFLYLF